MRIVLTSQYPAHPARHKRREPRSLSVGERFTELKREDAGDDALTAQDGQVHVERRSLPPAFERDGHPRRGRVHTPLLWQWEVGGPHVPDDHAWFATGVKLSLIASFKQSLASARRRWRTP